MSVNKYEPHVFVLPEDDANRQIANGFTLELPRFDRQIQVLGVAGGWTRVLDRFESDHRPYMLRKPMRFMVLLIDFDGDQGRLQRAKDRIPEPLTERVFILGIWTKPEDLRQAGLGSYEQIGMALAADCRAETETIWGHDLLRHNASELARLRQTVRPILFPPN